MWGGGDPWKRGSGNMADKLSKQVWIKVTNWRQYNPRTDVEKTRWFRMENTLLESAKFASFSLAEIVTTIFIFSQCSQANSETVLVNLEVLRTKRGISIKQAWGAIHKLAHKMMNVIELVDDPFKAGDGESALRGQHAGRDASEASDDREASHRRTPTLRNDTERDDTKQKDKKVKPVVVVPSDKHVLVNKSGKASLGDNSTSDVDNFHAQLDKPIDHTDPPDVLVDNSAQVGADPPPGPITQEEALAQERLIKKRRDLGLNDDGTEKCTFLRIV